MIGKYGRSTQKCAEELLERGLYHAACSDAHRPSDIAEVAAGIARLRALYGDEEVTFMLREGPENLLAGVLPLEDQRQSWPGRWRRSPANRSQMRKAKPLSQILAGMLLAALILCTHSATARVGRRLRVQQSSDLQRRPALLARGSGLRSHRT